MLKWPLFFTLLLLQSKLFADEWIGLETETNWIGGLRITEHESNDSSRQAYVSAYFPNATSIELQYSQSTLVDQALTDSTNKFDSESFFAQFSWPLNIELDMGLNYEWQGNQEELEIEQIGLFLNYNPYPFFASVEYKDGDLFIFTRDEIPPILNIPNSINSDLSAYSIQLGWWFENFSLSALHQSYDYEADISALGSRPLLQLFVKPSALAQTGFLISHQNIVSLAIPFMQRDLSLHVFDSKSAVDHGQTRSTQLDWLETLGNHSKALFSVSYSDEENDNWSFSVGLEWNS